MTHDAETATIAFDATPIADAHPRSGHGVRGVGRATAAMLGALVSEEPEWASQYLGVVVGQGQRRAPFVAGMRRWVTRRPGPLPQHVGWLWAAAMDRWAVRGARPSVWHATDATRPFWPLPPERSVVTVHDLIPLREPAVLAAMRPHRRAVFRAYLQRARRAAVLLTLPAAASDVARSLHVDPERIRILVPWVAPLGDRPDRRTGDVAEDLDDRSHLLLVGVPAPHKRFELGIRTLAMLRRGGRDVDLRIAGVATPRQTARLRGEAERAGVADRVELLGHIPDRELAALYRASVLLGTSRVEGFGLSPVEALVSGGRAAVVPITAYRQTVGDVAELADDASPSALADAVDRAIRRPPAPEAVSRLAARYSARACADSLLATYRDAIDRALWR